MSKNADSASDGDSVIGSGVAIEGRVYFTGRLLLEGTVVGGVTASAEQTGTLVVGENAQIKGEAQADRVVVNGTIDGPLKSTESLLLKSHARVNGDIQYLSIEVEPGAIVEGNLVPQGEVVQA